MKSTTAIGKIKTEFSLQNATSFGGVKIFLAFLEKIKLADAMRKPLRLQSAQLALSRSPYPALSHRRLDARL